MLPLSPDTKGGEDLVVVGPDGSTVSLEDGLLTAVVEVTSTDIRIQLEVSNPQLLGQRQTLSLDLLLRPSTCILSTSLDPLFGDSLKLPKNTLPLVKETVLGLDILEAIVLARNNGGILVGVLVLAAVVLVGEVVSVNDLGEFLVVTGELNLGGDNGVQPALDDLPDAPEDEGSLVDDEDSERFGVVSLKALHQELDEAIVGGEGWVIKEGYGG